MSVRNTEVSAAYRARSETSKTGEFDQAAIDWLDSMSRRKRWIEDGSAIEADLIQQVSTAPEDLNRRSQISRETDEWLANKQAAATAAAAAVAATPAKEEDDEQQEEEEEEEDQTTTTTTTKKTKGKRSAKSLETKKDRAKALRKMNPYRDLIHFKHKTLDVFMVAFPVDLRLPGDPARPSKSSVNAMLLLNCEDARVLFRLGDTKIAPPKDLIKPGGLNLGAYAENRAFAVEKRWLYDVKFEYKDIINGAGGVWLPDIAALALLRHKSIGRIPSRPKKENGNGDATAAGKKRKKPPTTTVEDDVDAEDGAAAAAAVTFETAAVAVVRSAAIADATVAKSWTPRDSLQRLLWVNGIKGCGRYCNKERIIDENYTEPSLALLKLTNAAIKPPAQRPDYEKAAQATLRGLVAPGLRTLEMVYSLLTTQNSHHRVALCHFEQDRIDKLRQSINAAAQTDVVVVPAKKSNKPDLPKLVPPPPQQPPPQSDPRVAKLEDAVRKTVTAMGELKTSQNTGFADLKSLLDANNSKFASMMESVLLATQRTDEKFAKFEDRIDKKLAAAAAAAPPPPPKPAKAKAKPPPTPPPSTTPTLVKKSPPKLPTASAVAAAAESDDDSFTFPEIN